MSRKPKISTDGAPPLRANPFAALQGALGSLPDGEPSPTTTEPEPSAAPSERASLRGKLVVRREKKGRGGKTATVIEGLDEPAEQLASLAQQLRRNLGCGAQVEGSTIVVGGAQADRVRAWLLEQGATQVIVGN